MLKYRKYHIAYINVNLIQFFVYFYIQECCRHKFIGSDDVVFSNISAIYQVSNDKTIKKLAPNKKFANAKGIHIHTKV